MAAKNTTEQSIFNLQSPSTTKTTANTQSYLQRLSNVIASLPAFTKDTSGYNYKYVTLDSIQKVLTPLLAENNLVLVHTLGFVGTGEERVYGVTSTILDTDETDNLPGDVWISSFFPIKHNQSPQDVGSARTYGMRYNVTALFNIILVGEDDDGASASKKSGSSGGGKKTSTPSSAPASAGSADSDW
jgi:hypothetical protein